MSKCVSRLTKKRSEISMKNLVEYQVEQDAPTPQLLVFIVVFVSYLLQIRLAPLKKVLEFLIPRAFFGMGELVNI